MNNSYVLDASAALDFIEDGPGSERVEQLLLQAPTDRNLLLMSVVNWGEVFYQVWQKRGEEMARKAIANLARLSIHPVPVDLNQSLQAAEIKVFHKIPYVDCLAAALAIIRGAVLVTGDRDFEKLGRRVRVLWIRR